MCAALCTVEQEANIEEALLDSVFFALSNPVRRAILLRLGEELLLVSELAAPFDVPLQAVSRHIQVLVRAGLVRRTLGTGQPLELDAASILTAAIWLNRYSKHWQQQFDMLAASILEIDKPQKRTCARKEKPAGTRRLIIADYAAPVRP